MGSGGGGQQTTQQQLPSWAQPFAQQILAQAFQQYFPGGHIAPASQNVAGFSPDQIQAQNMTEQLSGAPVTNGGQNYLNWQPQGQGQQAPQAQSNPLLAMLTGGGNFPGAGAGVGFGPSVG